MNELTNEELNRQVAEAMGWKKIGPKGFGSSAIVGAEPNNPSWPFTPLAGFCTDPTAAHTLLDNLREEGWTWLSTQPPNGTVTIILVQGAKTVEYDDPSFCRAACLCFLKSREVTK